MDNYCFRCMHTIKDGVCEYCKSTETPTAPAHHLKPGTVLNHRYMVGTALGEGGFGITYVGRDLNLEMRIAIKEFFPNGYANRYGEMTSEVSKAATSRTNFYETGKSKFLSEARVLAKFSGTKGIVDVRDYFEANNTAYIVMEFVEGITMKDHLKKHSLFDYKELMDKILPLTEALSKVHDKGLIHRDISPDNIMILPDGSLKLMDFGAARDVNFEDKRSLSIMLKPGYAPEEQYRSKGVQGPWTDIYALCATIYRCITGVVPDDAMERVFDDCLEKPSKFNKRITVKQENVLLKGLSISQKDRHQNLKELREDIIESLNDTDSQPASTTSNDHSMTMIADENDIEAIRKKQTDQRTAPRTSAPTAHPVTFTPTNHPVTSNPAPRPGAPIPNPRPVTYNNSTARPVPPTTTQRPAPMPNPRPVTYNNPTGRPQAPMQNPRPVTYNNPTGRPQAHMQNPRPVTYNNPTGRPQAPMPNPRPVTYNNPAVRPAPMPNPRPVTYNNPNMRPPAPMGNYRPNTTQRPGVKYCEFCGASMPIARRYCTNCGKASPNSTSSPVSVRNVPVETRICQHCGAKMPKSQNYCTACGKSINIQSNNTQKKSVSLPASPPPPKTASVDKTSMAINFCSSCGAVVASNSGYCNSCGAKIK